MVLNIRVTGTGASGSEFKECNRYLVAQSVLKLTEWGAAAWILQSEEFYDKPHSLR